jgi:transcriptional regulator GlxA family with amidase domain
MMSPVQHQKRLRLQEARIRLPAVPGDVAGVGHAVGYESPSQFSQEYWRSFGVPRARTPAGPARHRLS